ncbi:Uncharacterised protein [Yersinia pseudotuberculosis]|uniref:Uncharacterized protein n=1 Tax=Yersinia pseudotuberculosis TaxID=633 RepID=A0A380Q846_YERPU|nr:Uncharacterised protein [Yersinia pseudotuberculosis]
MAACFTSNGLFGLHVVELYHTYLFGLYPKQFEWQKNGNTRENLIDGDIAANHHNLIVKKGLIIERMPKNTMTMNHILARLFLLTAYCFY